jgi:hypothetical protein
MVKELVAPRREHAVRHRLQLLVVVPAGVSPSGLRQLPTNKIELVL